MSSPSPASAGNSTQRSLRIGASKNVRATSFTIITLSSQSAPPRTVAASLIRNLNASSGGVLANGPSPAPSLNSFATNRLR